MLLSEKRINKIVSETLNKFILSETFTNIKQLYHKMPINSLVNMIRVNSFFLSPTNHNGRGGKYYASLSRHKNNIEGFDVIDYAAIHENEIESYASITFNIQKLSRVHNISIRPFDYYANKTDDDEEDIGMGIPSKLSYQLMKKPRELMSDEDFDKIRYYDNTEYYNMAEENIISDTVKEIPEIFNYIDRIDLFFPIDMKREEYDDEIDDEIYNESLDESCLQANALCYAVIGTPWENKIVVNLTKEDKTVKVISISDFSMWLEKLEGFENKPRQAKNFLNGKPLKREDALNLYDYGHGHGHSYGHGYDYGHGHNDW